MDEEVRVPKSRWIYCMVRLEGGRENRLREGWRKKPTDKKRPGDKNLRYRRSDCEYTRDLREHAEYFWDWMRQ